MKNTIEDRTYFLKKHPDLFRETLIEFSKNPFPQASLNEIIKRSTFNKGSFYYRFADKNDLYYALMDDLFVSQYSFSGTAQFLSDSDFSLEETLHLLFVNLFETAKENFLYLQLLKNYYFESDDLKEEVSKKCIKPIFSRFFERFRSFLRAKGYLGNSSSVGFLVKDIEIKYFCVQDYLPSPFGFGEVADLIDDIIDSIEKKLSPRLVHSRFPLKPFPIPASIDETKPNRQFLLKDGELFALVAMPNSGERQWAKLVYDIASGHPSDQNGIGISNLTNCVLIDSERFVLNDNKLDTGRTLAQFLLDGRVKNKRQKQLEALLVDANLIDLQTTLCRKLSFSDRLFAFLVKALWIKPDLIVLDRVLDCLDSAKIQRFFVILLKYRRNPCTIVLTGSHLEIFMKYADRIGFFVGGAIRKISTPEELKRQYQQAKILIHYRNNTSADESIVFDFSEESKATWVTFLQGHSITEITTHHELDQNIFEKETGGNVG